MNKDFSQNAILEDIKKVSNFLGKDNLTGAEYLRHGNYSHGPIERLFGSIINAIRHAGLKISRDRVRIKDKNLILQDIIRVVKKLNRDNLSIKLYFEHGHFSDGPLKRFFGSITNAFKEAGLKKYRNIYEDRVIEDLKRCGKLLQKSYITKEDYSKIGHYSYSTVLKKLGGLSKMNMLFGFVKPKQNHYTQEQLINVLKKFYVDNNFVPTKRCMTRKNGYPCDKTYYAMFPGLSWSDILKLADLEPQTRYQGKDKIWYDSCEEMFIANTLFDNSIQYESHKRVCETRKWTCDFYLSDQDLWLEYDGLGQFRLHPKQFEEKINFYKTNNYKYLIITNYKNILKILRHE